MADDERRIEARPLSIDRGKHSTPEGIRELQMRRERQERFALRPTKAFSAILDQKKGAVSETEADHGSKEDDRPLKGPRPGLQHPSQRSTYGRSEEDETAIIIKG